MAPASLASLDVLSSLPQSVGGSSLVSSQQALSIRGIRRRRRRRNGNNNNNSNNNNKNNSNNNGNNNSNNNKSNLDGLSSTSATMSQAKALLVLLILTPLATSQSSSEPVREIPSNAQGPYYIPNDAWTSSFSSPSYSALYPFDAPDVSRPYPAPMIAGWSVSVAVQDDIPLTSATPNQLNATEREKFIAGVRVALNPPPDLRDGGDEGAWKLDASWRVCYSQTSLAVNGTFMRRLASDNGGCGGLWSSECLRKIEASMRGAWVVQRDSDPEGGCPFSLPMDCGSPSSSGFSSNAITAGEAPSWELGDSGAGSAKGVQVMGWGTAPGAEGDAKNLELARGFVNPLIIAFGPEDRSKAVREEVKVQIICPRAREEGDVGQSDGTGLRINMALVLGSVLGLGFYLT